MIEESAVVGFVILGGFLGWLLGIVFWENNRRDFGWD
jgi:hypothetical protein